MSYVIGSYRKSHLAERLLKLDGEQFSLHNGYDLYQAIYDGDYSMFLLKNARQTGKTITISHFIGLDSLITPSHKSLYISPSEGQTTRFSHTKLGKTIQGSPILRKLFTGSGTNNVFLKVAKNGSEITLSYCNADPDRIRGVTASTIFYDECQDMSLLETMTVAGACSDAAQDPRWVMSGTPKTLENGLEDYWQRSSQTEALIRCDGCKKWNKPSIRNIGKHGFICANCGKLLNVREFQWIDFNPTSRIKGFHIPQIIIPNHTENPKKWDILLDRFESWPSNKFNNEIMALSDSVGTRLIERSDLEKLCGQYDISRIPDKKLLKDVEFVVAGIDWSGGGKTGISRTVVSIFGVIPNMKVKLLYYKVYQVEDPTTSLDDIADVLSAYNVRLVMGDHGEGALANGMLMHKLGRHRVGQFQYGSFNKPVRVDPISGIYQLDKTTVIDNYFKFIKDEAVIFPNAVDSKVAFDDIMNEFSEVTTMGKKIWLHSPSVSDDSLHSQIGGWIAYKVLKKDLSFF